MRKIKRISDILKTAGAVLLALCLVLTVYATLTSGGEWKKVSDRLTASAERTSLLDRLGFSRGYFQSLRSARDTAGQPAGIRAAEALKPLSPFIERGKQAELRQDGEKARAILAYLNERGEGGFDIDAFLSKYEQQEGARDRAQINEIFEYLNGLSNLTSKSGKVLPKLKAPSVEPWFEQRYAQWQEEYGEDAGSYLEFLLTFRRLMQADGTVKNAQAFAEPYSFEDYRAALALTRSETGGEELRLFTDAFAEAAGQVKAGETAGFDAFFEAEYGEIKSQFAEGAAPGYGAFLGAAVSGIDPRADSPAGPAWAFDGSYKALSDRLRELQQAARAASFEQFGQELSRTLVKNSDDRSKVPLSSAVWLLAADAMGIGMAGLLLIVGASLLARLAAAAIIKKREYVKKADEEDVLLRVNNLSQYFKSGDYVNKAVDKVSFYIKKGEVFGLVGESGCGKTTTGRTIINLYDPTGGDVYFEGLRISSTKNGAPVMRYQLEKEYEAKVKAVKTRAAEQKKERPAEADRIERESREQLRRLSAERHEAMERVLVHAFESEEEKNKCTMLYREQRRRELTDRYEQDIRGLDGARLEERTARYREELKVAAKDNVMTKIQMIFQDPIASINPRMTVREIIAEGLMIRGVRDKKLINDKVYEVLDLVGLVPEHADRYPHEFSGGQRQRIGIARAIVLEPELIIADEPISALDVSIQAQIINLLNDLRSRMGLTIMFIAHNLSVVKYFSDRIAVMYYGRIVEMAPSEELFLHPLHPYTKSLLSAIPYPDPHYEKQRRRIEYEPILAHDYSEDQPELVEIVPGHFVLGNRAEMEKYRQEVHA